MKLTTTNVVQLKNTLVNDVYVGVIGNMLCWLQEKDGNIIYETLNKGPYTFLRKEYQSPNELLMDYFHMEVNMDDLINRWKQDKFFSSICQDVQGLRIVKQDPFECLISFIISQNNNISRITQNLLSLRKTCGKSLGKYNEIEYYQFPTLEQLSTISEEEFRKLGLGYRASYLVQTCKQLDEKGGELFLHQLQEKSQDKILENLLEFLGVGRKVADCVRLYSLKCYAIVPLDTHIKKLYQKEYSKSEDQQKDDNFIQSDFKQKLGDYAGWAQSFLFTAALQSKSKKDMTKTKRK
ncbi:8-oxoguanine glycosylase ogg1 [Paramecium bursaria]